MIELIHSPKLRLRKIVTRCCSEFHLRAVGEDLTLLVMGKVQLLNKQYQTKIKQLFDRLLSKFQQYLQSNTKFSECSENIVNLKTEQQCPYSFIKRRATQHITSHTTK